MYENTVNISTVERKMLDLVLAGAHHLAVFTLVALFAAEFVFLRPGIAGNRLLQLGKIDAAYGAFAGIVIVVGILRVIFGAAGWEYYVFNWVFWMKMAAFLAVGLLSARPTIAILGWRREAATNPDFTPPDAQVRMLRHFVHAQALALFLIPLLAAAMARGYGA